MTAARRPPGGAVSRAPRRRERDVQAAILSLLHARGVVAWKAGAGAFRVDGRYVRMGHKGVADIIGLTAIGMRVADGSRACASTTPRCVPAGTFLAIEVKTETGTVTPAQQAFLDAVQHAGGLAFVARSAEEVAKELGWAR